jgi:hypothetical protein
VGGKDSTSRPTLFLLHWLLAYLEQGLLSIEGDLRGLPGRDASQRRCRILAASLVLVFRILNLPYRRVNGLEAYMRPLFGGCGVMAGMEIIPCPPTYLPVVLNCSCLTSSFRREKKVYVIVSFFEISKWMVANYQSYQL